jgi:hypothetical protein
VSAIATATSTAVDAAIPTISVSGEVTTEKDRERRDCQRLAARDVTYRFAHLAKARAALPSARETRRSMSGRRFSLNGIDEARRR